jgi:hypothetical protein
MHPSGLSAATPRTLEGVIIGIDFDNTLVNYRRSFLSLALERDLLPAGFDGEKEAVRDAIRRLPEGEAHWMLLQAEVYGPRILDAEPAAGALRFLEEARRLGLRVAVVSHKTERAAADASRTSMREAARGWLEHYGFLGRAMIEAGDVYFEETRSEKIARIRTLQCTDFIDDLEDVLMDPGLPPSVRRHWYGAGIERKPQGSYLRYESWDQIAKSIFNDHA